MSNKKFQLITKIHLIKNDEEQKILLKEFSEIALETDRKLKKADRRLG